MRGWLLDTNVVSELRKPRPDAKVVEFVAAQPGAALYTTDVTFGEIRHGIEQLNDISRRADIRLWLDRTLRPLFADRVLAITEDVVVRWKAMALDGQKRGHTYGQPDLFIAAIAASESLVVVTRDVSDFVLAGVPVLDPWSSTLHSQGERVMVKRPATVESVAGLLGPRRSAR